LEKVKNNIGGVKINGEWFEEHIDIKKEINKIL